MARQFFSGGTMPSPVEDWWMYGTHYGRTLQSWLDRLDANRDACREALAAVGRS